MHQLIGADRHYETRKITVCYEAHIDVLAYLRTESRTRLVTFAKAPWWAPWRLPVFFISGPAHALEKVEREIRRVELSCLTEA